MVSPVFLDGELEGQQHEVSSDAVEQGIYPYSPTCIYTFTRVALLGRIVVVASVAGGIPDMALLWDRLASPEAQAAAE